MNIYMFYKGSIQTVRPLLYIEKIGHNLEQLYNST